jgi:hypothetical protein
MRVPKQDKNPQSRESSIGTILVRLGVIDEEQLQDALVYQSRASLDQMLGSVLVHKGFCTSEDIEEALALQKSLRKNPVHHAMAVADMAIKRRKQALERKTNLSKAVDFLRSMMADKAE